MDLLYRSTLGLTLTTLYTTSTAVADTVADTDIGWTLITTINGVDYMVCIPLLSFKNRDTAAVTWLADLLLRYLSSAL